MSAFDDNKAEEKKSVDFTLPPAADPIPETKPKRKPAERKPRAKKDRLET